jgi:hypothetical protein
MSTTTTTVQVSSNRITLLDIVKANGSDGIVGLVDETIRATPEVAVGDARTIKGVNYKTLIRKTLGTAAFRDASTGSNVIKSVYTNQLIECFILDNRIEADKVVADDYEDGAEAYIAMEASGVMNASLQTLGRTFYYGRRTAQGGDAKGNPGLLDYVQSSLVYNAAGTTASTGSSVWFVAFGKNKVQWVFGNNGQLAMTPTRIGDLFDTAGNPFTGYISQLLARPGLQVLNQYSVVRIQNLTADAGCTLTDAKLGAALALLPAAFRSSITDIFMAPRSAEQLRSSRTAINPTGAPAPTPTDFEQIPIRISDSISITEPINLT